MRIAIIGGGLAGLVTAVNLVDAGHEVEIFEARPFMGGKVGSWQDPAGNHIEMGLHVFFGCYENLYALMKKLGSFDNLLQKEHTHTFVNRGGNLGALDFRFPVGAPFHGLKAFFTTNQLSWRDKLQNAVALGLSPIVRGLVDFQGAMQQIRSLDQVSFADWFTSHGGSVNSIKRMWNPIAYALGFIDAEQMSARCMLTIFQFFAAKTDASILRMLKGSPDQYLTQPIVDYITAKGARIHTRCSVSQILIQEENPAWVTGIQMANDQIITADAYVCAAAVDGIKRLIPDHWRQWPEFDHIFRLESVPVVTVQLRFDGWVTELGSDPSYAKEHPEAKGLDNLLYTADADFSCFADLALTSPADYYQPGQGSLLQCVLTPGDPFIAKSNEAIAHHVLHQVHALFPSSQQLQMTWSSVVKLAASLYREAPGMDPYRPQQKTPVPNFFLAGSYTAQDYIDSMEGATISGNLAAQAVLASVGRS